MPVLDRVQFILVISSKFEINCIGVYFFIPKFLRENFCPRKEQQLLNLKLKCVQNLRVQSIHVSVKWKAVKMTIRFISFKKGANTNASDAVPSSKLLSETVFVCLVQLPVSLMAACL